MQYFIHDITQPQMLTIAQSMMTSSLAYMGLYASPGFDILTPCLKTDFSFSKLFCMCLHRNHDKDLTTDQPTSPMPVPVPLARFTNMV